MALKNKALNSFLSVTLAMGLLPYSAFADTAKATDETNTKVPVEQGSEFTDGGIAAKPHSPNTDSGNQSRESAEDTSPNATPANEDKFGIDSDSREADPNDEYDMDSAYSEPDYEDGKLAI